MAALVRREWLRQVGQGHRAAEFRIACRQVQHILRICRTRIVSHGHCSSLSVFTFRRSMETSARPTSRSSPVTKGNCVHHPARSEERRVGKEWCSMFWTWLSQYLINTKLSQKLV